MKINSVTIVGGGSAGWMTAALLSKYSNIKITLVESDNIKTVGVGESTLQLFDRLLNRLHLYDDKEWMPKCNATYKTSIAFKNWREGKGERFQYPFGNLDFGTYKMSPSQFFELQSEYGRDLYPFEEFARFCNHKTFLTEKSKLTSSPSISLCNFNIKNDTSYHIDADLFGEYLKNELCIPNGVKHIIGEVEEVQLKPNGDISHLVINNNQTIYSDLFVDCTGFKSLLLEKHLNVPFISFNKQLFNDKAIAVRTPYLNREIEMITYTDCVAMSAGWIWNIPLWHRIGRGYCYSSKYINESEAEVEFKNYLKEIYPLDIVEKFELKHINIKHGKHKVSWKNNCVAIGLSYGFVEPLESTGLVTSHELSNLLCDAILRRDGFISSYDVDYFNDCADDMMNLYKNLVLTHYTLTQRTDTEYWRDCAKVNMDSQHIKSIHYPDIHTSSPSPRNDGYIFISTGLGLSPLNDAFLSEPHGFPRTENLDILHENWQGHRKSIEEWVDNQPTHYQYLKDNIYC